MNVKRRDAAAVREGHLITNTHVRAQVNVRYLFKLLQPMLKILNIPLGGQSVTFNFFNFDLLSESWIQKNRITKKLPIIISVYLGYLKLINILKSLTN